MNTPARPIAFLALLSLIATTHASEEDAARHRIGVPKLQGRADIRTEEVESPTLSRVQDGLKETQALMSKIRRTEDPAGRRELMQQHLAALGDNLAQLRTLTTGDLTQRQMNRRVELVQAILDQMAERQRLEEEAPK